MTSRLLKSWSKAKVSLDICDDCKGPLSSAEDAVWKSQLQRKKVKQRLLTEITTDNVTLIKYLSKLIEVRHLLGIKGNSAIIDGLEYVARAHEGKSQSAAELIRSRTKSFVEQQQFAYETLWNKAIPADQRIREIEERIPVETTEIVLGIENIVRSQVEGLALTKTQHDACCDRTFPASLILNKIVWDKCTELQNRGVKMRTITEITTENIEYCKKMTERMELRHLDAIRGNFSISDKKEYRGAATMREGEPPTQGIHSTSNLFVEQQQYFFETLWNKAIPADQRIREIEEGITPEVIETFSDPAKSQQFAIDLVRKAERELLIMFASVNEFRRQQDSPNGFLRALSGVLASKWRKLDIRMTLPNRENGTQQMADGARSKIARTNGILKFGRASLRHFESPLSTRITIIIVDRKYALVVELKDDSEAQVSNSSAGLAIYSNSKGIVLSYVSIFELLWTHIDLYEQLKAQEVAQKEFIDIAVHELRTPIQPILGLAEEIQARQKESSEGRLLGIILKSASNLQRLADNLLDVARIQNNRLGLSVTHFDLNELISSVLADFALDAVRNKNVGLVFSPSIKPINIDADRARLHQVLSNCVQNALKFTPSGSVIVSATKTSRDAVVSIKDSGSGIAPEILPIMFSKFSTSSPSTGTGLGLFISRRIVEAHRGKISGTNNNNQKGATFTFSIPLKVAPASMPRSRKRIGIGNALTK